MNCIAPNQSVLIESPFSGRKLKLTGREKRTILSQWAKIEDKELLGTEVFVRIFQTKPSLKTLWGIKDSGENPSSEEFRAHPRVQTHAKSFAMFLDVAVRSLNLEGGYLVETARKVGMRHCYFKNVSFDAENWLLFKNSLIDALTSTATGHKSSSSTPPSSLQYYKYGLGFHRGRNGLSRHLWNFFLTFLIAEMKDAFCKGTTAKSSRESAIFTDPMERDLLQQLEEKYHKAIEDEEMENDVIL